MRFSALSSAEISSAKLTCLTGDLEMARVIVAGGRGLGSRENFQAMVELAGMLGAQVGGTRGALDMGWISHDRVIGLSGVWVAPEIYLGFGLSGANFHTIGIGHAGYIVAVNPDPKARIHELSHCSVLEDARLCIYQFTDHLRRLDLSRSHFDVMTIVKKYFLRLLKAEVAHFS